MSKTTELASALKAAFNFQNVDVKVIAENQYIGKIPQATQRDPALYKSSLGTPVMSNLTFKGATYPDNQGQKQKFDTVVLDLVLMNISQEKKIVETEIPGQDGVIYEYIGMGAYDLTINGIINGPNGHYPIDEVTALQEMAKATVPVEVISTYLLMHHIYELIIKSFTFEQEAGGYSMQKFTIQAKSSMPVFLQIR